MKLDELNLSMVTTAIDAYLALAYGEPLRDEGGRSRAPLRDRPDLALLADASRDEILALFQHESIVQRAALLPRTPDAQREDAIAPGPAAEGDGDTAASPSSLDRYTMRLGNRNYPFMKLLLQEHIVPGEFYFGVDSHDEMDIKPSFPDYEAWVALRKFNRVLKERIEERFAELDLPTAATIRELAARRREVVVPRRDAAEATILVVDDEVDLAEAVAELLEARGHRVHQAHDGVSGLAAARMLRPDLVLVDYELPELDGLEVIAALRADLATAQIPVLLSTASKIAVSDVRKADGFLAKPFQEDLLYELVSRLLGTSRQGAPR